MLCRVSCKVCHISCLWTDDPKAFIESVCMRYRHCEAKLVNEEFQRPARGARAKSVPREARKPAFPAVPAAQ
jgi:hypothetical protein